MRPQNKGGNPGGNNQTTGVNHHPDEDTSEWYKCAYVITVDNGKCGAMGGGRIKVWTDKKAWLANEPAHLMMHKARSAIHSKAKEHGIELRSGFASFAMRFTWPWTMLWQAFMHHVNLVKMEAMKLSLRSFKGHAGRNDSSLRSSWERGSDFANSQARTFAKQSVLALLEKRCDKSVFRVEMILSGVVSDLKKKGLDECSVVSSDTKRDVRLVVSLVQNAKSAIEGITNSTFNLRASKILTGFCAIMIPVGKADETERELIDVGSSIRHFCKLFGLGQ